MPDGATAMAMELGSLLCGGATPRREELGRCGVVSRAQRRRWGAPSRQRVRGETSTTTMARDVSGNTATIASACDLDLGRPRKMEKESKSERDKTKTMKRR